MHQRIAEGARGEPTSAPSLLFSPLVLNRDSFELKPREKAGDAIAKPLPVLSVSTNLAIKLARAKDTKCRAFCIRVLVSNLRQGSVSEALDTENVFDNDYEQSL